MADNRTQIVITARDETRAALNSALGGLKSLTTAAQGLPMIGAALATAFSASALTAGIKGIIDGADQLQKASQKYGIAVEQLSALQYAGALSDVSLEAIGTGLKKLSTNMLDAAAGTGEAKEAFKALGISVKEADGSLRSSDAVFADIADRFAGMEDGAGKTALAVKIFGRAGADLIPLLNQGSRGLRDMKEEADRLGAIVGGDLARAAEQFNDNLTRLGKASEAFGISIANSVLPSLNQFIEQLVVGVKAAGGFWEALKLFGTINPFKNHQQNIRTYADELEKVERRLAYAIPDAERKSLEASAETLRKRLAYLKEIAALEANAGGGRGRLDAKDLGPTVPTKAPGLSDASALAAARKAAEEARKAAIDNYNALHDQAMAAAEADARLQAMRNTYIDMLEPAAKSMRELRKFEEIAPALDLSADQLERIRDVFRDKINAEEFGKPLKDVTEEIKKQEGLAKDLGLTFQSAFEDAMVSGRKFSEVLKGLADDITRIIVRKTITEPLGGALSGLLDGLNLFGSLGIPKYAAGTPYVPEDQLAFLHKGEAVVPASRNAGGGTVVNIIEAPGRGGEVRRRQDDGGRDIIDILVDRVKSAVAGDIVSGSGVVPDALQGTYALNRAAGAWR